MTRGVIYIAYGEAARRECGYSINSLNNFCPELPITVVSDSTLPVAGVEMSLLPVNQSPFKASRVYKTLLNHLTPYDQTLYLDADTRVNYRDLLKGFDILDSGFDMVITPSMNQGVEAFWHVGAEERRLTVEQVGYNPVQFQGGVFWWNQNRRMNHFFAVWAQAWLQWQEQDQAALVRALHQSPLRLWLLGHDWNGGSIVQHFYGRAKER